MTYPQWPLVWRMRFLADVFCASAAVTQGIIHGQWAWTAGLMVWIGVLHVLLPLPRPIR